MPSWDIFEHQSQQYQDSVLPPQVEVRVAVEQASTFGWERYVGVKGRVIGMHSFGASAPLKELQRKFGFEPDQVVAVAKELLRRHEFETEDLRGQDVRDHRRNPVEKCSSNTVESLSYETANHS